MCKGQCAHDGVVIRHLSRPQQLAVRQDRSCWHDFETILEHRYYRKSRLMMGCTGGQCVEQHIRWQ